MEDWLKEKSFKFFLCCTDTFDKSIFLIIIIEDKYIIF
jgi:hypothetical protein